MNYKDIYKEWVNNGYFDEDFRNELKEIEKDDKEIEDRFFKDLEFGTGGMRGVIGAGRNRMNIYNIRKATQGFANYINHNFKNEDKLSIAIAYDSRRFSKEFALEASLVMGANGIKTFLFDSLHSTPELSFAVRKLNCQGGIVITASHNPPEYNGYKAYDERGCQMLPEKADLLVDEVSKITSFEQVKFINEEEALKSDKLEYINENLDNEYLDMIEKLSIRPIDDLDKNLKIVFTPLHGTGGRPVAEAIKRIGIDGFYSVEEQMIPDEDFTTVNYPNPEDPKAFELAIRDGKKHNADILMATDPDSDRVGVMVNSGTGDFVRLNGNQTGALLVSYILDGLKGKVENPLVVKTIVTSDLGKVIAESKGARVEETLTGFKFIGDKIYQYENDPMKNFVMGYEESYGYLAGTNVRDKDAVVTSMLIAEMAAYYKKQNVSLIDVLEELYKDYGYYKEDLKSITLKGKDGLEKMGRIMSSLRSEPFDKVSGESILEIIDCNASTIENKNLGSVETLNLPKSNVLKYTFSDKSWFAVRPSGTEPKIKIYVSAIGANNDLAEQKLKGIMEDVSDRLLSIG